MEKINQYSFDLETEDEVGWTVNGVSCLIAAIYLCAATAATMSAVYGIAAYVAS